MQAWTDEIQHKFLGALAASGLMIHSADAAGVPYETVRNRMRADDDFAKAVEHAHERYNEFVEMEIRKRGIEGEPEANFYKGRRCDLDDEGKPTVFKKSDRLLELHAKKRIPGYREKAIDVDVASGGVLIVNAPPATEDEWRARFNKEPDEDEGV